MRVLIVGAGLGGLCLAHALHTAGHDVMVFERSARTGQQPASYGIHLDADGLRALYSCLPEENWAMVDSAALPARDRIRFHDPHRGVISTWNRETTQNVSDPITRRRAISRGALRAALLHGLDEPNDTPSGTSMATCHAIVQWGRRFSRYQRLEGGRVRAFFDDGSDMEGDILVGADGSNSTVRRQRLPHVERIDLDIINIAGRTPVTDQLAEALPDELLDTAINNVIPAGRGWMFISTWNTIDPTSNDHAPADRYIVWAWVGSRSSYPDGVEELSGANLKDLVLARMATWPDHFNHLVNATDPATVVPVILRTMPELTAWEPSGITLLGDAIHNMTPMAGVGANTALRDALTLAEAVAAAPGSPTGAVATYERTMREYANRALTLSRRNAANAATESGRSRALFRTLLRLTEALPTLQHKIFKTPTAGELAGEATP